MSSPKLSAKCRAEREFYLVIGLGLLVALSLLLVEISAIAAPDATYFFFIRVYTFFRP